MLTASCVCVCVCYMCVHTGFGGGIPQYLKATLLLVTFIS